MNMLTCICISFLYCLLFPPLVFMEILRMGSLNVNGMRDVRKDHFFNGNNSFERAECYFPSGDS